jgi:hypothetical protein
MADEAMEGVPAGRPHFWYAPVFPEGFYEGRLDRAWLSQRMMPDEAAAARIFTDDEFAARVNASYQSLPDEERDFGLVNFGYEDLSDVPARIPEAVALEAKDLEQARSEAARMWEATGSQEREGHLRDGKLYRPDGYQILDTWGFHACPGLIACPRA